MHSLLPKISVVTVTYNRVDYLEDTILSVINQNYPNLEYIIIDGGSTDGTLEIIKKYEKHLSYWISEKDNGMYDAIQKGFNQATGDVMAWLNSDDKYHSGSLHVVGQIFSHNQLVEWIIGMPTIYNHEGFCMKASETRRWSESRFQIGDYKWIQQESVFWKKTLWQKAGMKLNTDYKLAADFELWTRFFSHAKLHTVTTILSGFRMHNNQLSVNNKNEYEAEVQQIIKSRNIIANSIKLKFIKALWYLYLKSINSNSFLAKKIKVLLINFIDRFHNYPDYIYYDFENSKWKI